MQVEKPAHGISVEYDSDDTKAYRVNCDCMGDDHAVSTWVEVRADEDMGVDVIFYVKTWTPASLADGGLWQRVKKAVNVLFKGVDLQEHGILLREQAALNWIEAVGLAIIDVKKYQR